MLKNKCVHIIVLFVILILPGCINTNEKLKDKHQTDFLSEEMILIPEGEFIMGSDSDTHPRSGLPSSPERKIFLKSFYISNIETTNFRFFEFYQDRGYKEKKYWSEKGWNFIKKNNINKPRSWDKGPYNIKYYAFERGNFPVYGIGVYEAKAYARYKKMRIPKEAEWEKAARGTDKRDYPWGNKFDKFKCNVFETGIAGTMPVAGLLDGVSPYGIHDMCGNVEEWTDDLYLGTTKRYRQKGYIVKGGAWEDPAETSKVWSRHVGNLDFLDAYHYGIRLAKDFTSN